VEYGDINVMKKIHRSAMPQAALQAVRAGNPEPSPWLPISPIKLNPQPSPWKTSNPPPVPWHLSDPEPSPW
jgi:hypothetical protein